MLSQTSPGPIDFKNCLNLDIFKVRHYRVLKGLATDFAGRNSKLGPLGLIQSWSDKVFLLLFVHKKKILLLLLLKITTFRPRGKS